MLSNNLIQLTDRLLPPSVCAQIKASSIPSSEVAYHLCILLADCEALNDCDSTSMTLRRLSKQLTALSGLMMIVLDKTGTGSDKGS